MLLQPCEVQILHLTVAMIVKVLLWGSVATAADDLSVLRLTILVWRTHWGVDGLLVS